MAKIIPFFYYDIFARVIPGAITLGVLQACELRVPVSLSRTLSGEGAWSGVVLSVVCLGASYAMGLLWEVFFALPVIELLSNWISDVAFARAKKHRQQRENQGGIVSERQDRYNKWNWLVHNAIDNKVELFQHAHRFQAEAKMCLHSLIPVATFVIYTGLSAGELLSLQSMEQRQFWIGIAILALLVFGAYLREWRRWLQVLIANDELAEIGK